MNCYLCNKNNFEKKYALKHKNIIRCKNDGLFIAQKTGEDNTYGKEYFSNSPNLNNQSYFLKKLKAIKLITKLSKPYILDIGCGWGDFEEVLEQEKIPYLGIDVNKEAIEICKKKGLNCRLQKLNQWNNETIKQFDVITLFQVIEHLQNPLPLLQSAKKLLKPNGIILITTPNNDTPLRKLLGGRWSVYSEPSHFVFYNKKNLQKTLKLAGFGKIQVKADKMRFLSLRYILTRLGFSRSNILNLTSNIPIMSDPFGDLEATTVMNYD